MRRFRQPLAVLGVVGLVATLFTTAPAGARHNNDRHSRNIKRLAVRRAVMQKDPRVLGEGSDLAFQRRLVVAGEYGPKEHGGVAFFRTHRRRPYLRQVSRLVCPGRQADVSVWRRLVFVSVDTPRTGPECGAPEASSVVSLPSDWEGVRIISIKDLQNPRQIAAVETDCGSHTHTLVPKNGRLFVYVQSYPLVGHGMECNVVTHEKISVIRVPLGHPRRAHVVSTPSVAPAIGCHDVTVYPRKNLAVAACISESQIWNIRRPAHPRIVAHIANPAINIHHSSAITWDGRLAVIGDETAGAAANACNGDKDSTVGAMWFYNITDRRNPRMVGHYALPRETVTGVREENAEHARCTTHNFNILPMKKRRRYVAVSAYYLGGLSMVNFTRPRRPRELAYYVPIKNGLGPDLWSAYWYNGRIYTNDFATRRGVSVFKLRKKWRKRHNFGVYRFRRRLNPQTQIPRFR